MASFLSSCRLCLELPPTDELVFSVVDTYQGRVLAELIDELFSIKVVENDRLLSVCLGCVNRINTVHKIQQLFIESNRKLQQLLWDESQSKTIEVIDVPEVVPGCEAVENKTESASLLPEDIQLVETIHVVSQRKEQALACAQPSESDTKEDNILILRIENANEDSFDLFVESENGHESLNEDSESQHLDKKKESLPLAAQLPQNKCYICGDIFESAVEFTHHLPQHFAQMPYTCLECNGLVFKTVRQASKHIGMHDANDRPFKCRICTLRFPTRCSSLTHERKIHRFKVKLLAARGQGSRQLPNMKRSRDKKDAPDRSVLHQCELCSKQFTAKKNLTRHLMIHTGEQPFKCDQCKRPFRQAGELKFHQRVHQSEQPYNCALCDKAFPNFTTLKKHRQAAHSSKKYGGGFKRKLKQK